MQQKLYCEAATESIPKTSSVNCIFFSSTSFQIKVRLTEQQLQLKPFFEHIYVAAEHVNSQNTLNYANSMEFLFLCLFFLFNKRLKFRVIHIVFFLNICTRVSKVQHSIYSCSRSSFVRKRKEMPDTGTLKFPCLHIARM